MLSDEVSLEVRQLVHIVVKSLIEKTKSNLKSPVTFEQVYMEACTRDINKKHDHSNLEIRHHVRDIYLETAIFLLILMMQKYSSRKEQLNNMSRFVMNTPFPGIKNQ